MPNKYFTASYADGKRRLVWANVLVMAFIAAIVLVPIVSGWITAEDREHKLMLYHTDHTTEFNCSTDSECYRDCMQLLDDADACERGLMEGGS